MKKSFIIKRRYEVLCEIEYVLRTKCRKCPNSGNNYSLEPCGGCPALHMLNAAGNELNALTGMYRADNKISKRGKMGEEIESAEEVVSLENPNKTPYQKMKERFSFEEHNDLVKKGLKIKEIANIYGVTEAYLYYYLREMKKGTLKDPDKKYTNEDKFDELFGSLEEFNAMKKSKKMTIDDIAANHKVPKRSIQNWIRQKKDKAGIAINAYGQ